MLMLNQNITVVDLECSSNSTDVDVAPVLLIQIAIMVTHLTDVYVAPNMTVVSLQCDYS